VTFVIFWTAYFFLYFFEYGSGGDYYFWASSYGVCACRACPILPRLLFFPTLSAAKTKLLSAQTLVFLIALGLSKYFTASILAAVSVLHPVCTHACRGTESTCVIHVVKCRWYCSLAILLCLRGGGMRADIYGACRSCP